MTKKLKVPYFPDDKYVALIEVLRAKSKEWKEVGGENGSFESADTTLLAIRRGGIAAGFREAANEIDFVIKTFTKGER